MAIQLDNLGLKINGVDLTPKDFISSSTTCKFLIKGVDQEPTTVVQLPGNIDVAIPDRFNADFLKHIAVISGNDNVAVAAAAPGQVDDTTNINPAVWNSVNSTLMNKFLESGTNPRNFVVSIQVVLIDAAKAAPPAAPAAPPAAPAAPPAAPAATTAATYAANDVAIIQFPLYRSNPTAAGAFGGRRRTKMSKRHPKHRTRKHKK